MTVVPSWHRADGLAELLAARTRAVLDGLDAGPGPAPPCSSRPTASPSASSPTGDTYPDQVAESGADIAALLDLDADPTVTWGTAWQSAGRTADPWIGPDLLVEMDRVAAEGATAVVVCPVGFVSDHLEVLYDLDIEARDRADALGIAFARTPSLNDDPAFLALLADVVRAAAGAGATAAGRPVVTDAPTPQGPTRGRHRRRHGRAVGGMGARDRCRRAAPSRGSWCSRPAAGWAARSAPPSSADGPSTWPPTPSWPAGRRRRELCDELGLTDALVAPGASGASLWARGRLRMMPDGVNLGVPTRAWPMVRSGILGPAGLVRAGLDLVLPHRGDPGATADRSVGDIVGSRLGHEVVERLVDPLVGGIHAGGVDDLSAESTFPPLLAADRRSGSLIRALRQPAAPGQAPSAPRPAPASRRPRCSGRSRAATPACPPSWPPRWRRGASPSTPGWPSSRWSGWPAAGPGRPGAWRWPVTPRRWPGTEGPSDSVRALDVDAVVVAVPAGQAAGLLGDHAPVASSLLADVELASVTVITLSMPAGAIRSPLWARDSSSPARRPIAGRHRAHHRVHLSLPEVAGPGPPRGRARPPVGRSPRRRPARRRSTTTS